MKKISASIKNAVKRSFDRIKSERIKLNILQAIPFWVGSLATGIIAVFYTKSFAFAEQGTAFVFHHAAWLFFLITPGCFVLAWWLPHKFSPHARGSGIPQVMAAIELANPKHNYKIDKLLSLRIIFIKIISSLTMVFGGGVIGREGPTIQIAGSIFRKINMWLPDWWPKISKRNMIMTGAAAGLAAAFNTPLGGIVFAVEELTKTHISYFKTALFTAVIIAGLTAQSILGPYLYLGYPDVSNLSNWMFLIIIPIALITGLLGSITGRIILKIFKWKASFKANWKHVLYAVICGLILATLAFFIHERVFGSGKEIIATTLFTPDKYVHKDLPFLRIVGPILSFTTGASGGIFAPALSAGASIGSVMAGLFHLTPTDSNLLILCGMVGFLTGVTRTPFTSAILVLEMTDRHNVIFHLMLAGMIAGFVSILIDKHSFYDHLKFQYVHDIHKEEEQEQLDNLKISN
ncbi:MAG: chloride channel protein [Ferruginibacter sp.]